MKTSRMMQKKAMQKRHFGFLECLFLCSAVVGLNFLPLAPTWADNACLSAKQQLLEVDEWVIVAKVIDGDTVHLKDGRKIRFIGINAPEIGRRGEISQPHARQAYQAVKTLLQGHKKIGLSYDRDRKDRYKRVLAYIILPDGSSVGQSLLAQGLAFSIAVPPNIRHINCFRQVEKKAKEERKGLWQLPEMQKIDARHVSAKANGYRFISGRITDYSESKKSIYLKLTPRLSIRIAKKDQKYFSDWQLKSLVGKKLLVRGWLNSYKGRQSIHARTTHNIQVLKSD